MLNLVEKISKFKALFKCYECNAEYVADYYSALKSRMGHLCPKCKDLTNTPVTQELVQRLYTYNHETGDLICKQPRHLLKVGDIVGSLQNTGYLATSIGNTSYLVHRLIWLYVKGYFPEQVDHINHNKLDNRLCNLREVSNMNNTRNCSLSKNSRVKVNGVSYMPRTDKFRAYIMVNRKHIHLGVFQYIEDAIEARKKADLDYGFHVNHGA